ncbi:hypothetical protein EXIGLDRAFT_828622 [Exidia glandulosa HHB12029]|uniref:Uncharacterized protein n=1 Tax=Exidia glandulosa HHB12029 TaxID=1314781 RepID=A0A165Q8Z4_EXIGL|nr:hypothetical protein EXIGLDRAFT_828622 [Exidia glandulosa HHB12029]
MSNDFERGYASTLALLQRPANVQRDQILGALAHYLAQLAVPHQTSLTRAAVLSPLYASPPCDSLLALSGAFETATWQRVKLIADNPRGVFARTPHGQLALWLAAVLEGTTSAPELVKIAILGGLLHALHELKAQHGRVVGNIENELVVAFASVMSASDPSAAPKTRVLAATFLQYIPDHKLAALDLPTLASFCFESLTSLYGPSHFITYLSATSTTTGGLLCIPPDSPLGQAVQRSKEDPQYDALAATARLIGRAVTILSESDSRRLSRVMDDLSRALESLAARVEATWVSSPLSAVRAETELEPSTRNISMTIWLLFKHLLFASTLISQSILSVLILSPHHGTSAPALASISLRTFSSLSFILHQFGGLTAPGGVTQMRRAVFNALDVVATDSAESDVLVRALADDVQQATLPHSHPVWRAKTSYALACIEQLVPVLSDTCIQRVVVPLCEPFLRMPGQRDTFEAAHSTVLAVFAWAAQRAERGDAEVYGRELVPGYVQALVQNSGEDGLNASQLRQAVSGTARATMHEPALALLFVETVLDSGLPSASSSSEPSSSSSPTMSPPSATTLRRGLMLASLLPALPVRLLPRVLEELRATAASSALGREQARELGNAVYEEISERAGDAARGILVPWWMQNADLFTRSS